VIKCECKKDAVIVEDKKYYCADCYINKFVRVRKGLRPKPLDNSFKTYIERKL
jgi:hypothetical protein